jgi:acetyltransferase-like isoleucine patch superfamily enzyme
MTNVSDHGRIDRNAVLRVGSSHFGEDVVIEEGVQIACDRIELGSGTIIRRGARIVTPEFRCGRHTTIGADVLIEVNDACVLGAFADIWRGTRIVAQSVRAGDHLWITEAAVIGGGGARGPRARLTIGDRSAIMDGSLVNVCEPITIGSDTALSNNVTVLTHSTWHPVLEGGSPLFAPVHIGDNVIVFMNAVIGPGVTIGRDCTIGAAAVVTRDVPDGATAFGNPARVVLASRPASVDPVQRDEIVTGLLCEYADTIPLKGGNVTRFDDWSFAVAVQGEEEVVRYEPAVPAGATSFRQSASITLSAAGIESASRGRCHFDLVHRTMTGTPSLISEDLRDFLRRRTIRIYADLPFRSLPPAPIARLQRQLES